MFTVQFPSLTEMLEEKVYADRIKYGIPRVNIETLNFFFRNRLKYDFHHIDYENVEVLIYCLICLMNLNIFLFVY